MDAIAAFRRDVFASPVIRANADQLAAMVRDAHGESASDVLLDAARWLEGIAVQMGDNEFFDGLLAAAMLLRMAGGE